MTLIQEKGKEKLLILKIKAQSLHTANISYRHNFRYQANKSLTIRKTVNN